MTAENPYLRKPNEDLDVWLRRIDPDVGNHIAEAGSPAEWLAGLDPDRRLAVIAELRRQTSMFSTLNIPTEEIRSDNPVVRRVVEAYPERRDDMD